LNLSTHWFQPTNFKRVWFFLLFDAVFSLLTFYSAYLLRFAMEIPELFMTGLPFYLAVLLALKLLFMGLFGVYQIPWRYFSLDGLERLAKAHIAAYALFFGGYQFIESVLFELPDFPRSVVFIDFALSLMALGALRIAKRVILESKSASGKAAVIIGVGREGELMARYLYNRESELFPLFFVDDVPERKGLRIQNLPVVGFEKLPELIDRYAIEAAVIATPPQGLSIEALYRRLSEMGIETIKVARLLGEGDARLKDLSIEDLLARSPKDLDTRAIGRFVQDKRVLITGAGGSIGSELARRALRYGADSLVLVESSEYNLYAIAEELEGAPITPKLLNVCDREALGAVFGAYRPQIVLHAAAYKHVPLVEANAHVAVANNIQGTMNTIDLAIAHGVETCVLISTDKAVRPTSVMGASKRVCELYAQNVPSGDTRVVAVRFGNVLGSSGSVIPRFKRLIEQDRPLTVTHPEMTRYFMLVSEAVDLVLQAASLGEGGEVFVLDMGQPVRIAHLARRMLQMAGREDLGIVYTGLRPGEKLYEELLIDESERQTRYESIFIGQPTPRPIAELKQQVGTLLKASDPIAALETIVPEFQHNKGA
jgi:UDP-N-acetyl-D-glucosamine 4,6-dehydratase